MKTPLLREEGWEEQVDLLRRQLVRRFGTLPEWADQKLKAADRRLLQSWAVQLLDAKTLRGALIARGGSRTKRRSG